MIKKEKNLLVFELDENKRYVLNINEGVLYGLKGKAIVTTPKVVKDMLRENLQNDVKNATFLNAYVYATLSSKGAKFNPDYLQFADRISSMANNANAGCLVSELYPLSQLNGVLEVIYSSFEKFSKDMHNGNVKDIIRYSDDIIRFYLLQYGIHCL